jgi:hypothetical protein
MAMALQWQTPLDRKCPSMTKAIRLQKPFDAKGRGSPIADALRWQTPFDGKGEALEGKE